MGYTGAWCLYPSRNPRPNNRLRSRGRRVARPGRTPTGRRRSPGRARVARFGRAGGSCRDLAAGLFGSRRLLDLLRLVRLLEFVRLLQFVGLRVVGLGRELGMMVLEVADGLTEVLVRHKALRLHLLEDLAPAGMLLLRCDLVERQRRGRAVRLLRLEQRPGNLLIPR